MKPLFIPIKPSVFTGNTTWESKRESVILVKKKTDIEPLYELLCEQDNYWLNYKNLIQVAPKEIDGVYDLDKLCSDCGKTDIYDVEKLSKQIPFIIYQKEINYNDY